ncbi:Hypothetical protein HVR_LOCUS248 [uncultured virus]|nr:Hypothetical protein HVR_LOCUS248 [uncultured virus]
MWYVTRRCYENQDIDFYSLTYDDNDAPCKSVKHEILEKGTPTEFLTNNRDKYELGVALRKLLAMIYPYKPDKIRTFNGIDDDLEIVSHTHVKIKGVIKSLSDLTIEDRRRIWSILYPRVYDIVGDEAIDIEGGDYIFAISSCITPLISNGGIMPHEERLQSTIQQVQSIRKVCPEAKIFLLESSPLNFDDIERLYDFVDYIFLFHKNPINGRLASSNKSLGESYVIHSLLKRLAKAPPYKLFIKFSGRYKLLNRFKLDDLSLENPTFRITPKEITWSHKGVCESILYSVPYQHHDKLLSLLQSIINGNLYIDIEHMLYLCFCPNDDLSQVKQVDELYVVGMCAGHSIYNRV